MIGNEFIVPRPAPRPSSPVVVAPQPALSIHVPIMALPDLVELQELQPSALPVERTGNGRLQSAFELLHRHTVIVFALLFLVVGSAGIIVAGRYEAAAITRNAKSASVATKAPVIAGLNMTVPADQIEAQVQKIISQPATITIGDKTDPISPEIIRSWLQITPSADKSESYIHIKADTIGKSLTELANKSVITPVYQVTSTHDDGSTRVIVNGKNGTQLTDPSTLTTQAAVLAKTLMDAKGMQLSTPMQTVAFQAVTPAAFGKLLEVDVDSKKMWAYENGQLVRTFLISAGKPTTPTPIGQFKIFSKLPVQDMRGLNPDGSKYEQPHVRWINYFLPGGFAVHGNYWRPADAFGTTNTSHGCVSLPDDLAKWVYDFAPLGTTVITHHG